MSVAALPQWLTAGKSKTRIWMLGAVLAVVLGCVLWFAFVSSSSAGTGAVQTAAQIYQVVPMDLEIKVTKDGEMQAVNNIDINCKVEGINTITTIVKEGTSVKKGDTLLSLDSTTIRQKIEDTSLDLQKAEADVSNAKEMLEIQKSTNDTNLESAQVALDLAKLDLKQYEEGSYPQQLANAKTDVKMASITLDQAKKLYVKSFVTNLDVTTAQNTLDKAQTALTVLTEYSHDADLTAKRSTLLQSEQRLNRTRRENNSNMSWRQADYTAKEQNRMVLQRRSDRLKEQYAACTVTATADGMVVYGSSSDRNAQTPIQEGAQVRERQLLVRLPDTSSMKAVVRIHESVVSRLHEGQDAVVRIVGQPKPLSGKVSNISVLADNSQRWWNPDLREYPVDVTLDQTPVDLKPGIGATVEVMVDRLPNVVAVPLDAVYTVGGDRYVFVKEGENARPVKVAVGQNNDTHIQITDGITMGQTVLRLQAGQGRELLEKAGIKVAPTTKPSGGKRA